MKLKQFKKHLSNVSINIPDVSKELKDIEVIESNNISKSSLKESLYRRNIIKSLGFVFTLVVLLLLIFVPRGNNTTTNRDILFPNGYPDFIPGTESSSQCPDIPSTETDSGEVPGDGTEVSLDTDVIVKIKKMYYQNIISNNLTVDSESDSLLAVINVVIGDGNSMSLAYYNALSPVVLSDASVNSMYNQYKMNNDFTYGLDDSLTNHLNSPITLPESEYEILLDLFTENSD